MLEISRDAVFLNNVINHPEVFPHVSLGAKSPLDLSSVLEDHRNYFLANEYGGFLLLAQPDYVYQVHTQFLPEGRGRKALSAARWAEQFMFTRTDALRLDTTVAYDNKAADWFTRKVGFVKWDDVEVNGVMSHYYVLTLKQWARNLCQLEQ